MLACVGEAWVPTHDRAWHISTEREMGEDMSMEEREDER
jgi:hypothetical protein